MARKIMVKDLKPLSILYSVSANDIKETKVSAVEILASGYCVKYNTYDKSEKLKSTDIKFKDSYDYEYFLNLSDAKERQIELRAEIIEKYKKTMNDSIIAYHSVLNKFTKIIN